MENPKGASIPFGRVPKRSDADSPIVNAYVEVKPVNVLLIEIILDRYVAAAQKRQKDWSPAEVEAVLVKLREEVLNCLK
jgi:hypothetical protein